MDNFSSLKDLVINIPNLRGCRLNLPIPVISSFDLAVETTHFLYYIKAKIKREKKKKKKKESCFTELDWRIVKRNNILLDRDRKEG